MKASVRRFHSPDVWDLAEYEPEDPEVFGFLLQVLVGPDNGPGEESFDIVVCTPGWLACEIGRGQLRWGRHQLLVHGYDWERISQFVRNEFESPEGETWPEVAEQLGRFGRWEFEDYVP